MPAERPSRCPLYERPRRQVGAGCDTTLLLSVRPTYLRCIQLRSRALLFPRSRVLLRNRSVRRTMLREYIDALRPFLPSPCGAATLASAPGEVEEISEAVGLAGSKTRASHNVEST